VPLIRGQHGPLAVDRRTRAQRRLSAPALAGVLIAAASLIAVVALSSRPAIVPSAAEPAHASAIAVALQVFLYLAVVVILVVLALLVDAFWPERRRKRKPDDDDFRRVYEPPEVPWPLKLVMVLAPFALLAGLFAVLLKARFGQETAGGATPAAPVLTPIPIGASGSVPAQAAAASGPIALIALGIVALLILM
jgi:hypothetical protein